MLYVYQSNLPVHLCEPMVRTILERSGILVVSCLEKSLNSVKVLEQYLISLLALEKSLKLSTLSETFWTMSNILLLFVCFKCCFCTSDAIASNAQSFSLA